MANCSDHRRLTPQLHLSVPNPLLLSLSRIHGSFTPSPAIGAAVQPSPFPFSPYTTMPTPSKQRRFHSSSSSFSSLFLLLFSLGSLYSLLPFLRSTPPSFSLFPFSFLVSLLSLLFSLPFSLPLPLTLISTPSFLRPLAAKSFLLTFVFLLRFHSLRYCSAAASILADHSGALAARSISDHFHGRLRLRLRRHRILGFITLTIALMLLSYSWDRAGCFPFLSSFSPPSDGCGRVAAIALPFLSGFLGFHERAVGNSGALRLHDRKATRLASLAFTTVILFVPACASLFIHADGSNMGMSVSMTDLGWPLLNTVIFGVLLNENFSGDDKSCLSGKDSQREFFVMFCCTLVLELVYFPKLSLPGFLICGSLLWVSVWGLGSLSLQHVDLGNLDVSESMCSLIMKPVRHILSERKSRKIALFLLINAGYMVVEFVAGFLSNSLGLISDACHMLFDCAALVIGLYASYISRLPANSQFNYGRGRFEVLSGYANAVFLVLVGALIVLESLERIFDPQEISTSSLLIVSLGGLGVNIIGLVFFHEEHHHAHGGNNLCSHSHSHSQSQSCLDYHSHLNSFAQPHLILHSHSDGDSHNDHGHYSSKTESEQYHFDSISNGHNTCNDEHAQSIFHHRHHQHRNHDHNHHHHHHYHQNSSKHDHEQQHLTTGINEEGLEKYSHIDHNMEGIFLHVVADTMGSIGVVISTLLIKYKGWLIADPACSMFISVIIISSVIPLLRNSAEILLQRIPRTHEQKLVVVRDCLMRIEGIRSIWNLHVWRFSNTEVVGTVHLCVSSESDIVLIKKKAFNLFHEAGVKDITIQVEYLR